MPVPVPRNFPLFPHQNSSLSWTINTCPSVLSYLTRVSHARQAQNCNGYHQDTWKTQGWACRLFLGSVSADRPAWRGPLEVKLTLFWFPCHLCSRPDLFTWFQARQALPNQLYRIPDEEVFVHHSSLLTYTHRVSFPMRLALRYVSRLQQSYYHHVFCTPRCSGKSPRSASCGFSCMPVTSARTRSRPVSLLNAFEHSHLTESHLPYRHMARLL